jgi:hypothetical protein
MRVRAMGGAGLRLGLALWLAGGLASAAPAAAQDIWATPPETSSQTSPPPSPAAAPAQEPSGDAEQAAPAPVAPVILEPNATYAERVLAGLRQIVARDFDGAIATLRAAAQAEPSAPLAFCHLGDAQLGKADWPEARAAYETCARFAALAKDGRALTLAAVGAARVSELSQQSATERRDAYLRLEAGASDSAAKVMAATRRATLDGLVALEADYAPVRKRIAEREAAKAAK